MFVSSQDIELVPQEQNIWHSSGNMDKQNFKRLSAPVKATKLISEVQPFKKIFITINIMLWQS
jgi:hypothetical protein